MIIDAIFLVCLLIFLVRGYHKGVVVAIFSVLALFLGVLGALKLSGTIAALLFDNGEKGGRWVPLLSYIIVFVLIVWLVRLGARFIQKSMDAVALGWINRLAGGLLYAFLVCVVFSSLLWLCNKTGMLRPETRDASYVYAYIEPLAPKVFAAAGAVLPFAKHVFEDLSGFFDNVNQRLPNVGSPR
ncbi:MAG: CvpA family protein [Sphingobacteriales bacterium]|nr:MAG: CvpA family protein [Sphingobacteriales bacterium]